MMITGDHPATACAIARQLGILSDAGMVLTGRELQALSDEALQRRAGRSGSTPGLIRRRKYASSLPCRHRARSSP